MRRRCCARSPRREPRIHILSGSPEQLRTKLEEKLRLDGARWDTFTLKPNLRNVLRLRFRAVRDQLGYKLPALLAARAKLSPQRTSDGALIAEILIGDDAESDALVYSIYADVVAGALSDRDLEDILIRSHSYKDSIAEALRCARILDRGAAVARILIHLDRQSPPATSLRTGRGSCLSITTCRPPSCWKKTGASPRGGRSGGHRSGARPSLRRRCARA